MIRFIRRRIDPIQSVNNQSTPKRLQVYFHDPDTQTSIRASHFNQDDNSTRNNLANNTQRDGLIFEIVYTSLCIYCQQIGF